MSEDIISTLKKQFFLENSSNDKAKAIIDGGIVELLGDMAERLQVEALYSSDVELSLKNMISINLIQYLLYKIKERGYV